MLPPQGIEELGLDSARGKELNVTGFRVPQEIDRFIV
jgi:hypothetical protein